MNDVMLKEYTGEKLYKYYSYNSDMQEMFAPVLKKTLRFSKYSRFNDPYDCYMVKRTLGENVSGQSLLCNDGICSFSDSYDNMLMWTHYASWHTGFVIEYDCNKLKSFFGSKEFLEKEKIVKKKDIIFPSLIEYSDDVVNYSISSSENCILKAVFHKPLCWSYEKELRSVIFGSLLGIEKNKDFKDFVLPENCISAIMLGSHFMKERQQVSPKLPICLKSFYESGSLFYMQLQSDKYNLEKRNDFQPKWCCEQCCK